MLQNNKDLIDDFINYVSHQKRYSRHTVYAYKNDLITFFTFMESFLTAKEISEFGSFIIRKWLTSLKELNIEVRSINRKMSTLRSFFKFLIKKQIILNSPMSSISTLRTPTRLIQTLSESDVRTLFTYVDFPDTWDGKTHELLLHILYNTGIRCDELVNLKISNINPYKLSIKVTGKGSKDRIIPVSRKLIDMILIYIKCKSVKFNNIYLLVTSKGLKLYPKYVYNTVYLYLSAVTTIDNRSPHVLRHTFATHLMRNGADLTAVKELLGHNSLASTQIYIKTDISHLIKVHARAHPKF